MSAQSSSQYVFGPANGGGDILHFENSQNQVMAYVDSGGNIYAPTVNSNGALSATGAFTQGSSGQTVFNSSGLLTSYNGLTTAGLGAPAIVAAVNPSGVSYTVFNTGTTVNLLPASAPAGTYRVSIYLVITTTFVTNTTELITIGWTDDDKAQTVAATAGALTAGTIGQNTYTFRSNGTAAITYTPSVSGSAATAGAAAFSIVLERLI